MDEGLEETAAAFGIEDAERAFIVEIATTLGWKVMPTSGVGRPDMILLRDNVVPVFLASRPMTQARARAFDAFALAGTTPRKWGRRHAAQIRKVLA